MTNPDNKHVSVHDVAAFLGVLEGKDLTSTHELRKRCQKMLYFVQGWSFAMRGEALFDAEFEAWEKGPVVKEVWVAAKTGNKPAGECDRSSLTDEVQHFIAAVWSDYEHMTTDELVQATHEGGPWDDRRIGLAHDEPSSEVIAQDRISRYFGKQMPEPLTAEEIASFQ